ncbi:MAG: ATP-binding protein [Chthoniobacter sp.]|uniref:sensor histidine kinase n=1 Tax=Chthoniobacter sp. TaxID=2510640 RepID=UPI0032AE4B13
MTIHEISPKQLRALLLLLVLVPFIPLVLMLRFMTDALEGERDAARERLSSNAQRALSSATLSVEKHLVAQTGPVQPEDLRRLCREVFDPTVDVSIHDFGGELVAGPAHPAGKLVAQSSIKHLDQTWSARAWLVNESALQDEVRDQFKIYAWTALIAAVAICAIAIAAGLTVNQQLRLHELKNTSVATVAHELRTPLATMRVLVDTLREGRYRNPEQLREYLDLLHSENLRLSRLTEHFLTHSRLARGQYQFAFASVDVESVVDPAINAMQTKLAAPGCTFTLDLAKPLPEMLADRDSLVIVLINLLENALKYSGDEKRITLRARRDDRALVFVVEDNGLGLTAEQRTQVFEPFYQADQKLSRSRSGCGLGLSIVRAIITAHRGRIEIASEPGEGAAFSIHIPLAPA